MTRRRWAGAAVLALAMFSLAPAVASAATPSPSYQSVNPSLTVSAATAVPGKGITVSGTGYAGDEIVDITVAYGPSPTALGAHAGGATVTTAAFVTRAAGSSPAALLAQPQANAAGAFSSPVTLTQVGMATITATGVTSGRTLSSTVIVLAAAVPTKPNSGTLPFTGANIAILAAIGVALALVGTVLRTRRKRLANVPAAVSVPTV
jgi:hypothetical protein